MHIYQSNEFLSRSLRDGKFTLVNAAYLRKLSAEGKKVPPCQELPDEARYKGPIDDESVLVLTISYCWASKAHPDRRAARPSCAPGSALLCRPRSLPAT